MQASLRRYGLAGLVAIPLALAPSLAAGFAGGAGAAIYHEQCAVCHGEAGQGGDGYEAPLAGDLPPIELARVIADTMPEGEPEACVGEEALAVAEFLHAEIYSPFARARNRPPRRRLSRLTARQFEQSLADLLGPGRPVGPTPRRGVEAYFSLKNNARVLGERPERVLPNLTFRLGEYSDLPEAFYTRRLEEDDGEHFNNKRTDVHVVVRCGVEAPRTGAYEFLVRSENGLELAVNHEPLIDARIRSGDGAEPLRGSMRLLGGRLYFLELKAKRTSEPDLAFEVSWVPPGGTEQPIPARRLSPRRVPPVFVADAPFPPDDRSAGFVSAATVSAGWHEAVARSAAHASTAAVAKPKRHLGLSGDEPLTLERARAASERFAERALRGPLSAEERRRLIDRHFEPGSDTAPIEACRRAVAGVLTSPRFLYPELGHVARRPDDEGAPPGDPAALEIARGRLAAMRLALSLWDSLPTDGLVHAAGRRRLHTEEQLRQHAERMLGDPRTRAKLDRFFEHWLLLDRGDSLSRDRTVFPDFDDRVAADMRTSLDMLIDDVVWNGDGDLRQLFLTDELYVNGRLAEFLGVRPPAGGENAPDGFVLAGGDHAERVGIVTHPCLVSALAYHRETSPIHRGVFLARHVLGRSLRPPPEAVAPLAPELAPELTTRERVAVQTRPAQCQTCHVLINSLGFTLEHFDAVGRYRRSDAGRPIDATGGYISTDGSDERLGGARELAEFLARCDDVHRSFVVQLFEHMTNQPIAAYGPAAERDLLERFREGRFSIRRLLVEVAVYAALADDATAAGES